MMRRSHKRAKSEMNVVPYIDVMLVLLVIFMISAPLLSQSVDVNLPTSSNSEEIDISGLEKADLPLIVTIDKNGNYFVENQGDSLPVTKEMIVNVVKDKLSTNTTQNVYIRADKSVDYGKVMIIMDMLKSAGSKSVGLIIEPNEEKS